MYDEASSSTLEDDSFSKQRTSNLMSMSGNNFGSAIARSLQLGKACSSFVFQEMYHPTWRLIFAVHTLIFVSPHLSLILRILTILGLQFSISFSLFIS